MLNTDQALEFLTELLKIYEQYEGLTGYIELRAFGEGDNKSLTANKFWLATNSDNKEILKAIQWGGEQSQSGRGVYIAYNLRKTTASGHQSNVVEQLTALYVDCDYYKVPDCNLQDVNIKIHDLYKAHGIKPGFMVKSGGGVQLVYLVESMTHSQWIGAQRYLHNHYLPVGSDKAVVSDFARVLRFPGFPNQKLDTPRETSFRMATDEIQVFPTLPETEFCTSITMSGSEEVLVLGEHGVQLPEEIEAHGTVLYEGRNSTLFKIGCKFRNAGLVESEIEVLLDTLNVSRCKPPLSGEEIQAIVSQVCKYEPKQELGSAEDVSVDDIPSLSLGEWKKKKLLKPESLITGLHRSEVGIVQAKPNVGKTTFFTNLGMSLACGKPYPPLFSGGDIRKVFYLDKENVPEFFIDDLTLMQSKNFDSYEQDLIDENFSTWISPEVKKQPLDLCDPTHLQELEWRIKKAQADFVIIDTLTEAFQLKNENDNSEVRHKVNTPIKSLAARTGAAIILIHHIGKGDAPAGDKLYRARGASSLSGMSRLILDMERVSDTLGRSIDNTVLLHFAKMKGKPPEDVYFYLNFDNRWFSMEESAPTNQDAPIQQLLSIVRYPMAKADIEGKLSDYGIVPSEVTKLLTHAVENRLLKKSGRGIYEPALEVAA